MRYYLDAAPIIYDIEDTPPFAAAVDAKLSIAGLTLITSELARLECRVKPLREGNTTLLGDFDDYFAHSIAELIPLTRDVVDRATEIRAQFNFKLTNDHRLSRFTGITVEVI